MVVLFLRSSRSQVLCATQTWVQQYLSAYQPYVSNSTYTSFLVFFCVAPVVQLLSFGTKLRRRSLHGVNRTLYVPALAPHCVGFHLNDCTPFLLCRSSCCTAEHLSPWVLPSSVREATRSYFLGLFSRQQREPVAKPWLATPSVAEVRSRLQQAPFQWPRPVTVSDIRALLRKGKSLVSTSFT